MKPRSKPSQHVHPENLKCAICVQYAKSRERKKFRISEELRTENLQKASSYFKDEIYTRIADLDTPVKMFAADLYCHKNCYANYIGRWNRATSIPPTSARATLKTKRDIFKNYFPFVKSIIDQGRGFSLSDIMEMINQEDDADLKNNEIRGFLIEEFADSISFCDPERKNQSLFAFSSLIEVQDVINSLRNIDVVKSAAIEIRKSLLDVNFGLENCFCDANQLKQSWNETKIPDVLLSFFATFFNVSSTKLMRSEITSGIDDCIFEDCLVQDRNEKETPDFLLMSRTKFLFQILYYHVTKGRSKTPLHVMNTHAVYKRCRSRELLTSLNRQSICISYKAMKELRKDLAKYTVLQSSECQVPLPVILIKIVSR